MRSIGASKAAARLPELLARVQDGEEIIITRHGKPAAVLTRPAAPASAAAPDDSSAAGRTEGARRVRDLLTEGAGTVPLAGTGLTTRRADQLVRDLRAGRDLR